MNFEYLLYLTFYTVSDNKNREILKNLTFKNYFKFYKIDDSVIKHRQMKQSNVEHNILKTL